MENFRDRLKNWLVSKTSRTIEVPGGASQDQSLIQRNQIRPAVTALRQSTTPGITPQTPSITSTPTEPLPTIQGQALIQSSSPVIPWQPKIGSKLPNIKEEKDKLIDAIIQKESSGRAGVTAQPKGKSKSYGLMQIEEKTWEDINDWRKKKNQKIYDFDKYWDNPLINRLYGTQYIFERIPNLLEARGVPVTFENVMASYTPGVGKFTEGNYDVKKYPNVLRDIAKIQNFYE